MVLLGLVLVGVSELLKFVVLLGLVLVGVSELLKFVVLLGLVLVGVSCSSLWCCWDLF